MVGCDEWMRWMNYVNEEKLTGAHQRERKNSKREEKFWRAPKREKERGVCVCVNS